MDGVDLQIYASPSSDGIHPEYVKPLIKINQDDELYKVAEFPEDYFTNVPEDFQEINLLLLDYSYNNEKEFKEIKNGIYIQRLGNYILMKIKNVKLKEKSVSAKLYKEKDRYILKLAKCLNLYIMDEKISFFEVPFESKGTKFQNYFYLSIMTFVENFRDFSVFKGIL